MKNMRIVLVLLCGIVFFTGCLKSNGDKDIDDNSQSLSEKDVRYINPLTGEVSKKDLSKQKPVIAMVSNIKKALPQMGISNADMFIEVLAEGGITRIMAFFSDIENIVKVGPIRSIRKYYGDIAKGYDPIVVHFGASETGYSSIKNNRLPNIDGMVMGSEVFIQDKDLAKKKGKEHSYFIDRLGLKKGIENNKIDISTRGYKGPLFIEGKEVYIPNGDLIGNEIIVEHSRSAISRFVYDAEKEIYLKYQNGEEHIDGIDNSQIMVNNIVVLKTDIEILPNQGGRIDIDLSKGEGYFATMGKYQKILWKKGSSEKEISITDLEGNPITFNKGKTWYNIISKTAKFHGK
ncbi:MAG: DUF3048 domain-containing protein [Oscillospiraceae bacterium]|nr:DUF3048 domain-containing protein [Oscillospiraceae bacterium]